VTPRRTDPVKLAGAICQGLVLGLLASVALINLFRVASDVQIFRYQGF
jgi:hypothetical protein